MSSCFSRQIPKIRRPKIQTTTKETLIFLTRQCVAFVGAGFSKPLTNLDWKTLLVQLLDNFEKSHPALAARCEDLKAKLVRPSAEDYALVGQEIEDIVGEDAVEEIIRQKCKLQVWS
jgi:hypothetical protein